MTKELFSIVMDCLKSVHLDKWKIQKEYDHSFAKYEEILFNSNGNLKVNGHWQSLSWLQKRKVKQYFRELKEETAIRVLQRLCDKA